MNLQSDTESVEIPNSFEWTDEFNFTPVTQDIKRTLGGSLIVSESTLTKGMPITLESGPDVWMTRGDFKKVHAMASVAGKKYKLTMADGTEYDVIFARDNSNPVEGKLLQRQYAPEDTAYMNNIIFRFYEVESSTNGN